MESKLRELREKRNLAASEIRSIDREIEEIEKQICDADKSLYKGKWFCKTEDAWDAYDCRYDSYEIVYVKDVMMDWGHTYLSAIIIKTDNYHELQEFNIEVDENFPIIGLEDMKEMTDGELYDMDESMKRLFECLFVIRPSLKNILKGV